MTQTVNVPVTSNENNRVGQLNIYPEVYFTADAAVLNTEYSPLVGLNTYEVAFNYRIKFPRLSNLILNSTEWSIPSRGKFESLFNKEVTWVERITLPADITDVDSANKYIKKEFYHNIETLVKASFNALNPDSSPKFTPSVPKFSPSVLSLEVGTTYLIDGHQVTMEDDKTFRVKVGDQAEYNICTEEFFLHYARKIAVQQFIERCVEHDMAILKNTPTLPTITDHE